MRRSQPPLATLRANWCRGSGPYQVRPTGPVAQAAEYGQLMGEAALMRQWRGSRTNLTRVRLMLGWPGRHLRAVA